MVPESCQWHDLQHSVVGGCQHDWRRNAVVIGSRPVRGGDTPAVARHESGEAVLRVRCREVVTDAALMVEKLSCDNSADGVAPEIVWGGAAAAIAEEPGQRVCATRFQLVTENVALCHLPSIAHGGQFETGHNAPGVLDPSWRPGSSPTFGGVARFGAPNRFTSRR